MNNERGYQVIEPEITGAWIGTVQHTGILFCLLNWFVDLILQEEDKDLTEVEIKVIRVEYINRYPAIGVYYKALEFENLEEYIVGKIEMYLREKSVLEFMKYAFGRDTSWASLYDKFIN